mmetsp:Transcript_21667/g.39581  ORF Transcript_21667/g.39581 Transcript_21667/m.39581 type:complete len:210 (+) Transcript_21667:171-800(+)
MDCTMSRERYNCTTRAPIQPKTIYLPETHDGSCAPFFSPFAIFHFFFSRSPQINPNKKKGFGNFFFNLDQQTLNLGLHGLDLRRQLGVVRLKDGEGNDVAGHLCRAAEGRLGWHKHVRDVLVFAEQREVQQNLDRVGVTSEDDQIGNTAVEGLGRLVGALLDELHAARLLHNVEDGLGQAGLRKGERLIAHFRGHCLRLERDWKGGGVG